MEKIKCPICGQEVGEYHELMQKDPYIHNNPYDGIMIYGAYSAPKETICFENNYLHFGFYDSEGNLTDHRLVQLNVECPATKTPSEEYMEGCNQDDFEEPEEEYEYQEPDDDDNLPF